MMVKGTAFTQQLRRAPCDQCRLRVHHSLQKGCQWYCYFAPFSSRALTPTFCLLQKANKDIVMNDTVSGRPSGAEFTRPS